MGIARLFFVEHAVKFNGKYYRDVLLSQRMLSVVRHVAGDNLIFLQDSTFAHWVHDTIENSNSCIVKHLILFLQSYALQRFGPEHH